MSSTHSKPLVLVLGATGQTGKSIVRGLLDSGNFRVAVVIRAQSLSKPGAEDLRRGGVEIRVGDVTDGYDKLKEVLDGVNIVVSAVPAWLISVQKELFRAAKDVGVQRVVPSDFAIVASPQGPLVDKLAIREYVKSIGVPYTFIDVGVWTQMFLPLPSRSAAVPAAKHMSHTAVQPDSALVLLTDLNAIGTFVARIVADPRTVNKAVIVWEDERPMRAGREIGEVASGEPEAMKASKITVTADDLKNRIAAAGVALAKDPSDKGAMLSLVWCKYMQSLCIQEDNTLANAKRLGYLDARELYPDIPVRSVEDFAEEFYKLPEPGYAYTFFE